MRTLGIYPERVQGQREALRASHRELYAALEMMTQVFHPSGRPDEQGHVEQAAHDAARGALEGNDQ